MLEEVIVTVFKAQHRARLTLRWLERIAGWGLHPLESAALSRRTPKAVIETPDPETE